MAGFPGDAAVEWRDEDSVLWAHQDGLVIALVPRESLFLPALKIVREKLAEFRVDAPGTAGELILDATQDWIWDDSVGAVDFTNLANVHGLKNARITLSLADAEDLESTGRRHFFEYRQALDFARAVVGNRYTG
ncbi:hypothetical protein FSO04_18580 [Paraburkholderia madseniana]|uniref:Uncharacterized protein n=1 Tax=Paraburkholderia madseniana TaxID=2599607 RepID=A0A6N6WD20_9BURK|nr:hypothetical protein [Paraburkholderia madseniana]KAE8758403.1 hypothetical protein FSO04_18580 [Paraburkholderia madseniana]